MWKIILSSLFFCFCYNIRGQVPTYIHFTAKEGLPSTEAYDIFQDSKGYIWFATDNGVSRYNGYEFENFSMEDGLHSQLIFHIYEDYKGRIWFHNYKNALSYFENDSIYTYKYNDNIPTHPSQTEEIADIKSIYVDSLDNVYIEWYYYGVSKIDSSGKYSYFKEMNVHDKFTLVNNIYKGSCYLMYPKTDQLKLINSNKFITPENKEYELQKSNFIGNAYYSQQIGEKEYIISIENFWYYINGNGIITTEMPSPIVSFSFDENGDLWLGTKGKNGAYRYSKKDGYLKATKTYLQGYSITDILRDKEGGLWFSTLENGIFYIANETYLLHKNLSKDALCSFLAKDNKNNVYVAVNDSSVWMINKDQSSEIFRNSEIGYFSYLKFLQDKLWIATLIGTFQYNGHRIKSILKGYSPHDHKFSNFFSRSIFALDNKKFYIGFSSNMKYVTLDGGNCIMHEMDFCNGTFNQKIRDLVAFKDKKVLIATDKGIYSFLPDTLLPTKASVENHGLKHPEFDTRIVKIVYSDFDENYYIATKEKGLLVWDIKKDTVVSFNKNNGLSDNFVSSIYCDKNIIWVGTKQGLNKILIKDISPFSCEIEQFSYSNGLQTNEINDVIVVDSIVYLATNEGLCYFNYNQLSKNTNPPPVYFTSFANNGINLPIEKSYNFSYEQNNVEIKYFGLALKANRNVQYRYRMEGLDTSWYYTKNRELTFHKLQSGNYHFSIYARNEDGVWSNQPAELHFIIKPPYWKTLWFTALIILITLSIISGFFKWRMHEINERNRILRDEEYKRHILQEKLANSKQKALIQQMNPHFIFNILNSIQGLILNENKEQAQVQLVNFARIMRLTLENSQQQLITIQDEIEYLTLYLELEKLRFSQKMKYNIQIDDNININNSLMPAMLIQPYLENAIIHGIRHKTIENGKIQLKFALADNEKNVLCTIEDNGIGRKKSEEIKKSQNSRHQSYGTKITEKRLELIGSLYGCNLQVNYIDKEDENGVAQGTIVGIKFPIKINPIVK